MVCQIFCGNSGTKLPQRNGIIAYPILFLLDEFSANTGYPYPSRFFAADPAKERVCSEASIIKQGN